MNFKPKISNFEGAKISSYGGVMFMDSNDIDSRNSSFVDSGVWELGFVKKDVYVYDYEVLSMSMTMKFPPTHSIPFHLNS